MSGLRIIAGNWKGRKLASPKGERTRPTLSQVRESLFNILGNSVHGGVWIDAYAGTGAVGLEALSRGASFAYFIESDNRAITALEENLAAVKGGEQSRLLKGRVAKVAKLIPEETKIDILFADPPYAIRPPKNSCDQPASPHPWGWPKEFVQLLRLPVIQSSAPLIIFQRPPFFGEEVPGSIQDIGIEDGQWFDLEDRRTYGRTELMFCRAQRN